MAFKNVMALVGFLLAAFAAAAVGQFFSVDAVRNWYPTLAKPNWTPPAWVFGPVWTVLYCMMGVAGFLVWKRGGFAAARVAMALFFVQLIFNAGWSIVFFGLRRPGWGVVEIVALWLAIVATTVAFHRVSQPAGWLFAPYLAWTTFAAALNVAIWRLNAG